MIYVLGERGHWEAVKIGFTDRPLEDRLSELQTGNHRELYVIKWQEGTLEEEHRLHGEFGQYRIRGEWFQYKDAVVDWLKEDKLLNYSEKKIVMAANKFKVPVIKATEEEKVQVCNSQGFGKAR